MNITKDLEHISFPEHSPVKTGGLKDIRLDAKEDKVEKIGKGEQARKTSSEMENHIETNTEEGERSDTPAQDDAAIILEVILIIIHSFLQIFAHLSIIHYFNFVTCQGVGALAHRAGWHWKISKQGTIGRA